MRFKLFLTSPESNILFENLANLVVIFAVPVALRQYLRKSRSEQREHEQAVYDALDDKYLEFQQFCIAHPELDIADTPHDASLKSTTSSEEKILRQRQELAAFSMLTSLFERAFLMYTDERSVTPGNRFSNALRRITSFVQGGRRPSATLSNQWAGWENYIKNFCKRQNFRQAFSETAHTYDKDFADYLNDIISPPRDQA
ncbi:MAG: hypothetical protein KDA61_06680 [Planctomycetales bacterium]|nr:hypothetical protein [Planctomycetales bacterium]